MEMSHAYMRETAEKMPRSGYLLKVSEKRYGDADGDALGTRYLLSLGDDKLIELEAVVHPEVPERYYLSLHRWHDLSITSYQLDTWKHFKDRVEFKFDINVRTGMGLSFIVSLQEAASG